MSPVELVLFGGLCYLRSLFDKVEVLGPMQVWLHPSEEAIAQGWATAMSGEFTMELRRNGRGERI